MPRHMRMRSNTRIYHIMTRGNERKNIFNDDEDRLRFIRTIEKKSIESGFQIYGYCLMDNHVHLLINEGEEGIAKVMKRINVSYVYYFNKKYKRIGHLFQDRYKSEAIENEEYLLAALRYIHNNPVKAGIVKRAGEYKWSSYNSYINGTKDTVIENGTILGMFSEKLETAKRLFIEFSEKWNDDVLIEYKEKNDEDRCIEEEKEAERIINEFLMEKKISSDTLNEKKNIKIRNELIKKLYCEGKFSIRKIAGFTGLNRGVVQVVVGKEK